MFHIPTFKISSNEAHRQYLNFLLSGGIFLLGAVVMIGWSLKLHSLTQIHSTFALMVYNTALAFMLCGLAAIMLTLKKKTISIVVSGAVFLLGASTLWQHISGKDLHIDQLFMQQLALEEDANPGRMSAPTALCFLLASLNFLSFNTNLSSAIKVGITSFITPIIIALPLTSALSYIFGFQIPYGWGNLAGMAVHTSIGFITLGLLILLRSLDEPVRMSILPGIGVTLMVFLVALWSAMDIRVMIDVTEKSEQHAEQLGANLLEQLQTEADALQRMSSRIQAGETPSEWSLDANFYINHFNSVGMIRYSNYYENIIASAGTNIASIAHSTSKLNRNLCQRENIPQSLVLHSRAHKDPLLIHITPTPEGCIVAARLFNALISQSRQSITPENLPISIRNGDDLLLWEPSDGNITLEREISFQDLRLTIKISPTKTQLELDTLALTILFSGLFISTLLLSSLYLASVARRKSKQSEHYLKALEEQESMAIKIVEMAPNALMMINQDGRIELSNTQANSMFGYEKNELLNNKVEILIPSRPGSKHPKLREDFFMNPSQRSMGKGRDLLALRKDGSEFSVEIGLSPISTRSGLKVLASIVDITKRKDDERKQLEASQKLIRINSDLSNFTYIASHDLKAPLRGIDQLATWITQDMGDTLSDDTKDNLRLMRSRINRMTAMLDDLLTYSRADRSDHETVEVDTHSLVNDIFNLVTIDNDISLTIDGTLPTLETKRVPLELVFRNLISNAIKHNDKAQGKISISARQTESEVLFSVRDNGPGISPEHQSRIFGMFETLKPRDKVEGSGMGLAISKRATESVGGKIELESDGTNGCTFTFSWPK